MNILVKLFLLSSLAYMAWASCPPSKATIDAVVGPLITKAKILCKPDIFAVKPGYCKTKDQNFVFGTLLPFYVNAKWLTAPVPVSNQLYLKANYCF